MSRYVGFAWEPDVPDIKAIADANKSTIGFVRLAALKEAEVKSELIVARSSGQIVGFARFHRRRDGWVTLHEICMAAKYRGGGWGEGLLRYVLGIGLPVRCKVPQNGPVSFYKRFGFEVIGKEPGKKRELFVCEYRPGSV